MTHVVGEPVVLPSDAQLVAVDELPEELRAEIPHRPGDRALTRPLSRHPSTIVDPATAELLEGFRSPVRIVDAVLGYSAARKLDPAETLERAFPVLREFMNAGLLVPADSELAHPIEASLEPGAEIGGLEVVRPAQVLVDTEVYLAQARDGTRAALKLARPGFEAMLAAAFSHEAGVLRALDRSVTPSVLADGRFGELPYLALDWRDGVDAHEAAARARARGAEGRDELLALVEEVIAAYAHVHGQGVLHGDVHPRNLLVDGDGNVTIIDFGLARAPDLPAVGEPPRGGIDFFAEPELAVRSLAGEASPPVTAPGEQYAIAALAYLLLTGAHTHRFSLEPSRMLRQLADDPPLAFAAHGARDLDAVERVATRALRKDPSERFENVAFFLAGYRRAVAELTPVSPTPRRSPTTGAASALLTRVLGRLSLTGDLLGAQLEAPTASLQNGSAGFAYALLRIASIRGDEELLALADVWAQRSERAVATPDAFTNEALEITPERFGERSLSHSESGVRWTSALVASARADPALELAVDAFASCSSGSVAHDDISFGRAGLLVGCALLHPWAPDHAAARVAGDRLARELQATIDELPPIAEAAALPTLGIAHGWAGLLYALLLWAEATETPPSGSIQPRLEQLERLAVPLGRGLAWPHAVGTTPDGMLASWCNGAAGHTHLWALAHRVYEDEEHARLTEQAARAAADGPDGVADLCCGLAGRAYAALAAHKLTGDTAWLARARELADRAAVQVRDYALRRDSLYKGEIGIAVLAADLERPLESCMPAFEAEAWAEQARTPIRSARREQS